MLKRKLFKTPGIPRAGFEYQDLIGIEILVRFYRDPSLYNWVELESESEEFGALDDIVAARTDGSFEVTQVKFTPNTEEHALCWDWLLAKRPKGTCLLRKWSDSLKRVEKQGPIATAQLRTNRRPDAEISAALRGERVDFEVIEAKRRHAIAAELGGEEIARRFFAQFQFSHSERLFDELERELRGMIVPTDTDASGWLLLRHQARTWATRRSIPEPDGRIRHEHLVQIITKRRPRPIPQDFQVPPGYVAPSRQFDDEFQARVKERDPAVWVLWGTPGRGKSTYLSYLVKVLRDANLPVIRHHYFLSLDDSTTDRISFTEIANSLMEQLAGRYPDAVSGLESDTNQLRKWLEAAGRHYAAKDKRFIIVVDGLDHVWREQMNISQMNHLFSYLLPLPDNVVLLIGTQRVPDEQLPFKLLRAAGPEAWIEIPRMDESAVYSWVNIQAEAGRVRLSHREHQDHDDLNSLARAFFEISGGHPLHLIYSFEALVRRGAIFTADEVRLLPACPEGDIREYYRGLWSRLTRQARQVLHLISGSDFHWPPEGIQDCVGPFDEVDHLLEHRRTGIIPFHGSILAYVREQSDHASAFKSLLPTIVRWLETNAPEYWRWAWLWLTKARLGDADDLVAKTTRTWVIDSLARGWPNEQIVEIVRGAEHQAFARLDLPRTFELRSLKTRLLNAPEFQTQSYPAFEEAAVQSQRNLQRVLLLADELATLEDDEVLALAHCVPPELSADIGRACVEELRRRVNIWLSLRHRPGEAFVKLAVNFFELLTRFGDFDADRAIRFAAGFREPATVVVPLLRFFERGHDVGPLLALRRSLTKKRQWRLRLQTDDSVVRLASRLRSDLGQRLPTGRSAISPLLSCWLHWDGSSKWAPVSCRTNWSTVVKERYEYGPNRDLELFFHDVFFSALAHALIAQGEISFVLPGFDRKNAGWMQEAIETLEEVAFDVGRKKAVPSFQLIFDRMGRISQIGRRGPSDAAWAQYRAFQAALLRIAWDLHILTARIGGSPLIGLAELTAARQSSHWSDDRWLGDELERLTPTLDRTAAADFLNSLVATADNTITEFNERADRWVELARLALLYQLPQAEQIVRRAANCLIGYGWRKDMGAFDVLDVIKDVSRHDQTESLTWLASVVPIIDKITQFTDGDETDHARSELVDLVAEIAPDKLPLLYAHHITSDEWRYAEDALRAHLRQLDYADPASRALAGSLLEAGDIATVGDVAEAGNAEAQAVQHQQERFIGGLPDWARGSRSYSSPRDHSGGPPPDVRTFKPAEFARLLDAVSDRSVDYQLRAPALVDWLRYWLDRKKAIPALRAIERYLEETENPHPAEDILDEAFLVSLQVEGKEKAYPWLVRAHVHLHGWASYWSSAEKVRTRLQLAAAHYGDRWKEYVKDTSVPSRYWQRRKYDFTLGSKYLVHFLLLVGEIELAKELTRTFVRVLAEEVSDQPIPPAGWFQ